MKRNPRPLLAALLLIFLVLILVSGWKILSILSGYREAAQRYDGLANSVVVSSAPVVTAPTPSQSTSPDAAAVSVEEETPPEESAPTEYSPVTVDFDELRRLCGDVIGWICLPDTVINYPVVQGRDNAYYLERFLDGSTAAGGTLFADFVCPSDFSGQNTIIYGHNMRNGSMFALVDDYADQSFYEEHPVMYLNTPSQNYRIDFFSGFTADPESFVYATAFSSDEEYSAFLRRLIASSEISCPVGVGTDDRIVTLSTCTYSGEDLRFVLCGKLTEIG